MMKAMPDGDGSVEQQHGGGAIVLPITRGDAAPPAPAAPRRPPRRVSLNAAAVAAVATASAVAAVQAPGQPTGIGVLDVVLKAFLGAACALAGSTAPWAALTLASAIAVVATVQSVTVVPSGAAFGVSLAAWLLHRRDPNGAPFVAASIVRAAAGAVLVQVACRLAWPHTSLAPTAVGAVIVLVVLVTGVLGAPRLVRRVVVWIVAVAAVVAVLLCALAGFSLLSARSALEGGLHTTQLAGRAAQRGDEPSAATDFATAEQQFASAQQYLTFARLAEVVPIVSQQVQAVRTAADIADQVAAAARATTADTNLRTLAIHDGVVPIAAIEDLAPVFEKDLRTVDQALGRTAVFRSPWLVSPIRSRVDELLPKLDKARDDSRTLVLAVHQIPFLVGAHGTRTYLVLFENPAETRGSGGVVGNYALVTASDGRLHLGEVGSVAHLDSSGSAAGKRLVGPSDYVARYSQFAPEYFWQNVPMSPDFPSVGEVAANLYPESGGSRVDGVISLDPEAIGGFLKATGPVTSPLWPVPIDAANVVGILAHQQFVHFATDPAGRERFVTELIKLTWHAITSRPLPPFTKLTHDLGAAIHGNDLLMYSTHPVDEQLFRQLVLAGAMPAVHGDFLGVVTQNFGGNKLDWYLHRTISYHATLDQATQSISGTVTLTMHNDSPTSGQPQIVIGPEPGVPVTPGENELWVSIYSPWQYTNATLDGRPIVMTSQTELGRNVYSAIVKVPAGGQTTLVMHLSGQWPKRNMPYQLGLYHQPMIWGDHFHASVRVIR